LEGYQAIYDTLKIPVTVTKAHRSFSKLKEMINY